MRPVHHFTKAPHLMSIHELKKDLNTIAPKGLPLTASDLRQEIAVHVQERAANIMMACTLVITMMTGAILYFTVMMASG